MYANDGCSPSDKVEEHSIMITDTALSGLRGSPEGEMYANDGWSPSYKVEEHSIS
jgi:hypothetical protein